MDVLLLSFIVLMFSLFKLLFLLLINIVLLRFKKKPGLTPGRTLLGGSVFKDDSSSKNVGFAIPKES